LCSLNVLVDICDLYASPSSLRFIDNLHFKISPSIWNVDVTQRCGIHSFFWVWKKDASGPVLAVYGNTSDICNALAHIMMPVPLLVLCCFDPVLPAEFKLFRVVFATFAVVCLVPCRILSLAVHEHELALISSFSSYVLHS